MKLRSIIALLVGISCIGLGILVCFLLKHTANFGLANWISINLFFVWLGLYLKFKINKEI